jgi:hypothetical protein
MRPLLPFFLGLAACTDKAATLDSAPEDTGTEDTSVFVPPGPQGDPYLGLAAATTPGSLRSECNISVEVVESSSGNPVASVQLAARGRDWAGTPLPGGVLLRATATATNCVNRADPAPFTSGTFSGEQGIFVVFWYTSVNLGYSSLTEGSETGDFVGGSVLVTFAAGTPVETVQSAATTVSATPVDQGDGSWAFNFDAQRPIGEVLAAVARLDGVVGASPVWVTEPDWW